MKHPDKVAACARRLAAKLIADQAAKIMVSVVSVSSVSDSVAEDMAAEVAGDDCTIVLVAEGWAARRVLKWLDEQGPPRSLEVERDGGHA